MITYSRSAPAFVASALLSSASMLTGASTAAEPKSLDFLKSKPYDQLTPAEITAAKNAAKKRRFEQITFCADPGNMPLSNNRREGYQNKIAELVAAKLGARANFFWRPYIERGLTRETFDNHECDVLLDMPVGSGSVLLSMPIYRSTYVLAWRTDRSLGIESLDNPKLKSLKIGVFQHSAMRIVLSRRSIPESDIAIITPDADLRPENQPWRQVQKVADGNLDIAAVWGPFAGYVKSKLGQPLTLKPTNLMDDQTPLEFSLAFGIPTTDVVVKFALDMALDQARSEIAAILADFGVPLVSCSDCIVAGDLPSHGSYDRAIEAAYTERFLKPAEYVTLNDAASADQRVDEKRVSEWLAQGAILNEELENAVTAADRERVALLIAKGADVNRLGKGGEAPIHIAAQNRHSDLVALLLERKADPNLADSDGMTALLYAVMRNHVPSIQALAAAGADLSKPGRDGHAPILIALMEGKLFAAQALIELGIDVNARSGSEKLTPLMVLASQLTPQQRVSRIAGGPSPAELAGLLIRKGADVNAQSHQGVTALMIAAGHDNTPLIGLLAQSGADFELRNSAGQTPADVAAISGSEHAAKMLRIMHRSSPLGMR